MDHLETEARNPTSTNLDELTPLEIVRLMNAEDAKVIPAVASQAEAIAHGIEIIAERLRAGGRLVYVGAGTSGRLGVLDATECPPTFNAPAGQVIGLIAGGPAAITASVEGAEDHPEFAERDLAALSHSARDVLVGIATSGRTPYVLGAIAHARRVGAFTIGLSCNADSELIPEVDLAITPVVGPEVLSGSTRLKAGTATKLVLNMLTTGAMVRLGKSFGNLMVDLRATNNKLKARTNRIVRLLTGLDQQAADSLLAHCDGELKTALVCFLANISPDEARRRLDAKRGQVRAALAPSPTTAGMREETRTLFDLLRKTIAIWSESAGHNEANVRGSQPRKDIADQIVRYRAMKGRDSFLDELRESVRTHFERNLSARLTEYRTSVLGIDGGGTNTVALLAQLKSDQDGKWTVLGRGEAGPSNRRAVGAEQAFQAIDEAVAKAFRAAAVPRGPVQVAWLGLAGAGRTEDQELIRRWALQNGLAAEVEVTADAPLLLAAGTPDNWGVAVVSGTGSIAFARSSDGRTARSGGWGYLLGDEGSGYALSLAALQAVARMSDARGPDTLLARSLLERLALNQPQELIAAIYRDDLDRPALAAFAPLVLQAAEAGDAVAGDIVQKGADHLALMIASCAQQLGLVPPYPLVLSGGLLLASTSYRDRLLGALSSLEIHPEPVTIVPEPAEGAVRLAISTMQKRNLV